MELRLMRVADGGDNPRGNNGCGTAAAVVLIQPQFQDTIWCRRTGLRLEGGGQRQGGSAAGQRRAVTWEGRGGPVGAPSWGRQEGETWSGWCWVQGEDDWEFRRWGK